MTDKELLELAARAAGFANFEYASQESGICVELGASRGAITSYWNPLTNDGDALRLAVKLGLVLNLSPREDCKGQTVVAFYGIEEPCWNGRNVAARRAIVRAAAAIGAAQEPKP